MYLHEQPVLGATAPDRPGAPSQPGQGAPLRVLPGGRPGWVQFRVLPDGRRVIVRGPRRGSGGPPEGDSILDGLLRANTAVTQAHVDIAEQGSRQRALASIAAAAGRLRGLAVTGDVVPPLRRALQQLEIHAPLAIRADPLTAQKVTEFRQLLTSAATNIAAAITARRTQLGR